jgi:hypothetical protein
VELEYKDFNFEIKAIDEKGFFEGYASTFNGKPDLGGDVVMPGAFLESIAKGGRFGTGIRFLRGHDRDRPIGVWTDIHEDQKGLFNRGQIAIDTQDGHDTHILLKMGAMKGESIGYFTEDYEIITAEGNDVRYLKKIDLYEISVVTFPMNTNANVTMVKEAIENCKTERQLENALKDMGLSSKAAQYVISVCKKGFQAENNLVAPFQTILRSLQQTNAELLVKRMLWEGQDQTKGA